MQLRSAFFGSTLRSTVQTIPAAVSQGFRVPTTCMAKKKGEVVSLKDTEQARPPRRHQLTALSLAGIRCIVTLECTEARKLGKTPSRYTTQKASVSQVELLLSLRS